jgi:hypothetical protein
MTAVPPRHLPVAPVYASTEAMVAFHAAPDPRAAYTRVASMLSNMPR